MPFLSPWEQSVKLSRAPPTRKNTTLKWKHNFLNNLLTLQFDFRHRCSFCFPQIITLTTLNKLCLLPHCYKQILRLFGHKLCWILNKLWIFDNLFRQSTIAINIICHMFDWLWLYFWGTAIMMLILCLRDYLNWGLKF